MNGPPPTHDICPYTLKLLTELAEVNDEHIFPDAIGGLLDYKIRVSTKQNSDLGTMVDGPLINSFLISGLRFMHGIKSRSGDPKLKLRGVIKGTSTVVDLTFSADGSVSQYVRNPVDKNDAGTKANVTVSASDRDAFIKAFVDNHQKKGVTVEIAKEQSLFGQPLECDLELDLLALKRGIAKIAFCGLYEYLGDQYLNDPLVSEWHKMLFSEDPEDVRNAKIHGVAFDLDALLDIMLPPLKPYQHGLAIANLKQRGPIVAVSLFGKKFHSLIALASETSNYGLDVLEGKIVICDTKASKTTVCSFGNHFVYTANRFPML
ncbi:MAG: hypothetical protein ABIK07_05045 [Planctomycetota bacterium]